MIPALSPRATSKGPAFIIWNHQSRRDHTFITTLAWPRKISIVAEYNSFFREHLHWPFKMMRIIPKKVFTNDMISMRAIHNVIKQGGIVAFSPEGTSSIFGDNQPIVPGTGRFLQAFGVPVYVVNMQGSYLTNNKICSDDRLGKVYAKLKLMFTPEDLKKMKPEEIDYINPHGTSTGLGDIAESQAIAKIFGDKEKNPNLLVSATKSMHGHMLGATGAAEAIICIKVITDGIVPPTINLDNQDEQVANLDYVPHKAREKKVNAALSNSFGFGGHNATLIFKAVN